MKNIFFILIFILLLIVIAIFGVVIAAVFARFPQAVFPVWMEIPIAVALGWLVYRRGGNVPLYTSAAVVLMYLTVVAGHFIPLTMGSVGGIPPTGTWVLLLLAYAFTASCLPVTTLLQPRDYINAWQLFIAMALLVAGVFVSGITGKLALVAPAFQAAPAGAPPLAPFLFITIACGAVSGFHSLVASGTTAKQIAREPDARFVGYGSMLMEAGLATLVIIAVAAGIGIAYQTSTGEVLHGAAAWSHHYSSWTASTGLGSKLTAVVVGSANMMDSIGIPRQLGIVIMGVFIASFAGTTLDTSTRLQRYVVSEMFSRAGVPLLAHRSGATAFAVLSAAILAFATGANGMGALTLWPMFGAANQLLAALALLVVTSYLIRKGGLRWLVTGIPFLFMITVTLWAVIINEIQFFQARSWLLVVMNGVMLLLAVWVVIEGTVLGIARMQRTPEAAPAAG